MATVFSGGRIFIGNGGVIENGVVVVDQNKIVAVDDAHAPLPPNLDPDIDPAIKRISLAGKTLLPGFIDCHVHLCSDCSPDPMRSLTSDPPALTALKGAEFARRTLMAGVTTVRDMGGKSGIDLILRDAIRSGLIAGPCMVASGRLICMTGGHGWPMGREADGPEEVRKAAREQIKAGADLVKFMATGGVLTPGVEPGNDQLTEAELRAGIDEAHKAGKKTAAHAQGTKGILNALKAGIDSIEHGIFLDEETTALMVKRGVPLIPTIAPLYGVENAGPEVEIPPFILQKVDRIKPSIFRSFRMAREAGVMIGMGTDAGTPLNLHGKNLRELKLMVENGCTPPEAMVSGTGNAARILGREDQIGTIAAGKNADIVLVAGNPLENIDILLDPENFFMIMQDGKVIKHRD